MDADRAGAASSAKRKTDARQRLFGRRGAEEWIA